MSLRSALQDRPAPLVWAWRATARLLTAARPLLARVGLQRASRFVGPPERVLKGILFDCRDCGQCVLHYTGMTCPMTCPKQLRNGPCGGVRANGHCEVDPDLPCVWVKAVERSARTPYADEIMRLNPPVDWRLAGLSSWVTFALGRDQVRTGGEMGIRTAREVLGDGER